MLSQKQGIYTFYNLLRVQQIKSTLINTCRSSSRRIVATQPIKTYSCQLITSCLKFVSNMQLNRSKKITCIICRKKPTKQITFQLIGTYASLTRQLILLLGYESFLKRSTFSLIYIFKKHKTYIPFHHRRTCLTQCRRECLESILQQ